MLRIAFSPVYKYTLPEGHRFPMIKYELLPEQLLREGTIYEDSFFKPLSLSDGNIELTHTKDFLDKLNNLSLTTKEVRNIGFPIRKELVDRGRVIAGGTCQSALYAMEYGVAMNIAGGTHHSFADRGEGFCVFNDVAIASNLLLQNHCVERILIVDLDVHQGNGTAKIFEKEPRVFTFSMHGEKNYPTRKEISDLDIGLPDKTEGKFYLDILRYNLEKLIDTFCPQFVFYNAGVDILDTDKLGRLSVSREDCKTRDKIVLELMKRNNIPISIAMGGGYSIMLKDIIEAHANTFRVAQEVYF